jgi:hypothetical protein
MIEVFVHALDCTSAERFHLLVLADLNPFADNQGNISAVDMTLVHAFFLLKDRPIVKHLVNKTLNQSQSPNLPDEQLIQLIAEIVDRVR